MRPRVDLRYDDCCGVGLLFLFGVLCVGYVVLRIVRIRRPHTPIGPLSPKSVLCVS